MSNRNLSEFAKKLDSSGDISSVEIDTSKDIATSANAGIGAAASSTYKLTVVDNSHQMNFRESDGLELALRSASGANVNLVIGDGTDTSRAGLKYVTSTNELQLLGYDSTARIKVASDGDVTMTNELSVTGQVTGPTTDTLLVKNSSGTTLKTIRGV